MIFSPKHPLEKRSKQKLNYLLIAAVKIWKATVSVHVTKLPTASALSLIENHIHFTLMTLNAHMLYRGKVTFERDEGQQKSRHRKQRESDKEK